MASPTLSVVMANYNHGRYLRRSLTGICEQSLKPHEVILLDDGSTDDSLSVMEEFARKYSFVRLIKNPRNMGAIPTLNQGIALATGDFVACLASDDGLLPGLFEKTAVLLSRYPNAGLCSAMCVLLGKDGEELGPFHTPRISDEPCFVPPEEFQQTNKKHGNWILSQTAFYNRKAWQDFGGGFDRELGPAADGYLVYCLGAKYGACFIPEPLGSWRKLDDSFALKSAADNVEGGLALIELMDAKMRAGGLFSEDFLERSKRSGLMVTVYEINRRRPYRFDGLALVGAELLKRNWTDRLFFAWLRALSRVGHWSSKLYLFLYQPPRQKRRIVFEKLAKLIGLGRAR